MRCKKKNTHTVPIGWGETSQQAGKIHVIYGQPWYKRCTLEQSLRILVYWQRKYVYMEHNDIIYTYPVWCRYIMCLLAIWWWWWWWQIWAFHFQSPTAPQRWCKNVFPFFSHPPISTTYNNLALSICAEHTHTYLCANTFSAVYKSSVCVCVVCVGCSGHTHFGPRASDILYNFPAFLRHARIDLRYVYTSLRRMFCGGGLGSFHW